MVTPIMIGCLSFSSSCGTSVMILTASRRESPDLLGCSAAGDLVGIRVSSLISTNVISRLGVDEVEELALVTETGAIDEVVTGLSVNVGSSVGLLDGDIDIDGGIDCILDGDIDIEGDKDCNSEG